ncbi:HD domain-containing protein [Salinispira pacifica]
MTLFEELAHGRITYYYTYISALDRYFRKDNPEVLYLTVRNSLVDLARVFTDLEFPQIEGIDGAVTRDGKRIYFTVRDEPGEPFPAYAFPVLNLVYDPSRDVFLDPLGIYPELRRPTIQLPALPSGSSGTLDPVQLVLDAALLAGRYHYQPEGPVPELSPALPELPEEMHRTFVRTLFCGTTPWKGLDLLMKSGFVDRYWPVFVPMNSTDQSKGHHPEGNVWEHSLETLRYRKTTDLVLSLSLFMHDCGKPYSQRNGERRFDGHAEIGADIARSFLEKLGFSSTIAGEVWFLVKYHMVPGALSVLPVYRTEKLMASPLFPLLLELYRCDLSSTYRGPDGYYDACKVYRSYLRNVHNPFRGSDGKKLVRLYVE